MKQYFSTKAAFLMLLMIMVASSCTVVGTLYPVYDNEKSYIIKNELVGKWSDPDDKKSHILIKADESVKAYTFSVVEKNDDNTVDTTKFIGHLVNSNGTYFLEYWYQLHEDLKDLAVVRHFIAKINFAGKDKLELNFIEGERLVKLIDEKKLQLTYAKQKAGVESYSYLILDKSPVLQKAVAELKKYPDVFSDKVTLVRSE